MTRFVHLFLQQQSVISEVFTASFFAEKRKHKLPCNAAIFFVSHEEGGDNEW